MPYENSPKEHLAKARNFLSKRRVVLLASVAASGAAVIFGGPAVPEIAFNGTAAHAVEAVQPRAGFADLITRVKPAVISVRVKIEQDSGSGDNQSPGENNPMEKL